MPDKPKTNFTVMTIYRLQDGRLLNVTAGYQGKVSATLLHDSGCYLCGSGAWMQHKPTCARFHCHAGPVTSEAREFPGKMSGEKFRKECEALPVRGSYMQIVANAADFAKRETMLDGRQGIYLPMSLYHCPGSLLLTRNEPPAGYYVATGRTMPINVPYEQIIRWIDNHSRDLPIL